MNYRYFRSALMFFLLFGALSAKPLISFAQVVETREEAPLVTTGGSGVATVMRLGNAEDENEDKTPGATVRGRVVYLDTGRPVRRAEISLVQVKNGYESRSKNAFTNSNGEFEMTRVKAGTYAPYIKMAGVFNENNFNLLVQCSVNAAGEKNAPANQITVAGLEEVNVFIQAKRGGAISGRITYFDGEPAVGMKVEVLKKGDYGYEKNSHLNYDRETINVGAAVTDDRGVYRFSGLPEGNYIVRVVETAIHTSRPSSTYYYSSEPPDSELKTYYPNAVSAKDAKPVELALGDEQSEINLTIPDRKFFSLKGTVVAKGDKIPLKDFVVTFNKIDDEGAMVVREYNLQPNSENTDAEGKWDFVDLPQGKYLITVKPPYDHEYAREIQAQQGAGTREAAKYAAVSKEVTFEEKDIRDLVLEVSVEAVISGTVVMENGKPLPKALFFYTLDATRRGASSTASIETKEKVKNTPELKSEFTLRGLNEGSHRIILSDGDAYIKEIRLNGATVADQKIELKEGQQLTGAQIVLAADFGTLKGKINNFNKNSRTFVVMVPSGNNVVDSFTSSRHGVVKETGAFEIKAPPGDYSVIVVTEKEKFDSKTESQEDFFKRLLKNPVTMAIKANVASEITLEMPNQ